ncbi:hypothetical protein Q667_15770 [Marinobacter sp. C1S70]|uniref:polysaccharide pyruvyl transferase family protein n=1 Tax=Marinobacter sp. C1S70 TaxID=1396859 RepID=UPI0003B8EB57|nr:polysaccharide pyruvyl transferase family protein [Marinobacter sp. C1S70]ERS87029.1 hypothetical protein Q667_15770 [Marinobacter sp. C1S70]
MRIALVTIHRTANYGAVLQAYATQKILAKYGEVKIVNYKNSYLDHHLNLIRFDISLHGILKFSHDLLRLPYRSIAVWKFRRFFSEFLNLTQAYSARDLFQGKAGQFDIYICGSDQIWNPDIVSENREIDPIFFLGFAPKNAKKISYASSIGHHHFSCEEKKVVKELLSGFSMVSTREVDGIEKLHGLVGSNRVNHVVDPTLLLTKDDWKQSLNLSEDEVEDRYILVYSVPRTELLKQAIDYVAQKTGWQVICVDQMLFPAGKVDKHVRTADPREFVKLFLDASFVITDSFHGTCFAVNFSKPFVSVSAGKRSNRMQSLLAQVGLSERLISSYDELASVSVEMDWEEASKNLAESRSESLEFIEFSVLSDSPVRPNYGSGETFA